MSATPRLPVATLALIGATLVAAVWALFDPTLIGRFGFVPAAPTWEGALLYWLLHANVLHLLGNLVFLAAVGATVEIATGTGRFVSVVAVSVLAGLGLHWATSSGSTVPLVGASAAVSGCVGYYSVRYLWLRVPLAPKVAVPIAAVIGIWAALQVAGAFVRLGDPTPGTAFWAHLGGLASGLLMSAVFRTPDLGQLQIDREVLGRVSERSAGAALAAAERHLERHPEDPRAIAEMAEALRLLGDEDREAEAWHRALKALPESHQAPIYARLAEMNRLQEIPRLQRTLLAERFRTQSAETARLLLVSVLDERAEEDQRPEALLALAGLEREANPDAAAVLLEELATRFRLHPACEIARARGWLG